MNTPFSSISQDDLKSILSDLQYALDGLWNDPSDITFSTGISEEDATDVYASIEALLNLDLKK